MTQDEIIEMAREAGFEIDCCSLDWHKRITAFANLVAQEVRDKIMFGSRDDWVLAEREACAMLAQKTVCDTHIPTGVKIYGTAVAKAIRARGEQA